ncbi:helix-turn-helix domain-containing protein [Embleya sp. NBC_00896]|uniref:helix-turn-helix transcriptional regulator n=1 Tax=Embleya sp. NBC_00896 TaxID=2975961 RepID=UPI002F90F4D5|nr:transcriptional regulator [Embleya sp. NBC_00896]
MSDLSSSSPSDDGALDAVGVLADPVRRALYRYVAAAGTAVGRAEAAEATGIQRTLAAFHLDKLVEARLLDTEFARPAGKGGPGAGRPAKLYRRSAVETSVTLPPRAYDTAGHILADAVERAGADRAVHAAAHDTGRAAGMGLAPSLAGEDERARVLAALEARGYEPTGEPSDADRILLRNCPFHQLAEDFPPLVCGMNLALLEGLLEGVDAPCHRARLDSVPGRCCVVVERTEHDPDTGRSPGPERIPEPGAETDGPRVL